MDELQGAMKSWMNVREVAEYLNVKPCTVYAYVNQRRIPHYKAPGSQLLRFRKNEVDEWIETGRVETVQEYLERKKGE